MFQGLLIHARICILATLVGLRRARRAYRPGSRASWRRSCASSLGCLSVEPDVDLPLAALGPASSKTLLLASRPGTAVRGQGVPELLPVLQLGRLRRLTGRGSRTGPAIIVICAFGGECQLVFAFSRVATQDHRLILMRVLVYSLRFVRLDGHEVILVTGGVGIHCASSRSSSPSRASAG